MKNFNKRTLLAGLLVASSLPAGLAFAQSNSTPSPGMPMVDCGRMQQGAYGAHHEEAPMRSWRAQRGDSPGNWGSATMAKRQALFKAQLQLKPEQEGAWSTLVSALQAGQHPGHPEFPDELTLAKLSTPERLDKINSLHTAHQAAMNAARSQRSQAIKTFYATLSSEQQKVFDAISAPMLSRGMGMGMGHVGHHGLGCGDGPHPHHGR